VNIADRIAAHGPFPIPAATDTAKRSPRTGVMGSFE
jgi:hypothetical protein